MPRKKKPLTIEQEADKLFPPPDDGWKPGQPYLHERVEWMKRREQWIVAKKQLIATKELEARKIQAEGKKQCPYEGCKLPCEPKKAWCRNHANECETCFERVRYDEKYCSKHCCELCGKKWDTVKGKWCPECVMQSAEAEASHKDYPAEAPHPQALRDAELAGLP